MKKTCELLKNCAFCVSVIVFVAFDVNAQIVSNPLPLIGAWNGYNGHTNIVECSNHNGRDVGIGVTVMDAAGETVGLLSFVIPAFGTYHANLNSFDIVQNIGTYTVDLLSGFDQALGGKLNCSTAIYRFSPSGAKKAIDYAFSQRTTSQTELVALTGESAGIFNSMNPDVTSAPVPNWLTVYNLGSSEFSAVIELYGIDGSSKGTLSFTNLAPGARRDIGLGHEFSENQGRNVGLYRIVPTDSDAPYGAFLTRYGDNQGELRFAFALDAQRQVCNETRLFVSTIGPATNWVEIANTEATTVDVVVEVLSSAGLKLATENFRISPYSQAHFLVNSVIGDDSFAHLRLTCGVGQSRSIVAQSVMYGHLRNIPNKVEWAAATTALKLSTADGKTLVAPVNTYLGVANWLKTTNASTEQNTSMLRLFGSDGVSVGQTEQLLLPSASADVGLHAFFTPDVIASVVIGSGSTNGQNLSELWRVFPHQDGGIGYIMPFQLGEIAPEQVLALGLRLVAQGFSAPLYMTNAGDRSDRLFVVEKGGKIKIIDGNTVLSAPFLDISSLVSVESERGLLGLVFHPNFSSNGRFFVDYTDINGDTVVAEYLADENDPNLANPSSARVILGVFQSNNNHNGGQLHFGADGFLYISLGDGGGQGDPLGNGQNRQTLLGSILRIDVDGAIPYAIPPDNPFVGDSESRAEIWAYGFRNPWRFSFDRSDGRLFVGDVGQNALEEIDIVQKGGNYGWKIMEGRSCFSPSVGCQQDGLVLPISEYGHGEGVAVIGGYVYRGSNIPALTGKYLFGDFASAKIWMLSEGAPGLWTRTEMIDEDFFISAFGEDESGELYVVDFNGSIYQIVQVTDS